MYEPDQVLPGTVQPNLTEHIFRHEKGKFSEKIIKEYQKLQQADVDDDLSNHDKFYLWLKNCFFITKEEWNSLLEKFPQKKDYFQTGNETSIYQLKIQALPEPLYTVLENIPKILFFYKKKEDDHVFYQTIPSLSFEDIEFIRASLKKKKYCRETIFLEWFSNSGLVSEQKIYQSWEKNHTKPLISKFMENEKIISIPISENSKYQYFIDFDNYERLLKYRNKAESRNIHIQIEDLIGFYIQLYQSRKRLKSISEILEIYEEYYMPDSFWEGELFSNNIKNYTPKLLDQFLKESSWRWKKKNQTLCFTQKRTINSEEIPDDLLKELNLFFPPYGGKYSIFDLENFSGKDFQIIKEKLISDFIPHGAVSSDSFHIIRTNTYSKRKKHLKDYDYGYLSRFHKKENINSVDEIEEKKNNIRILFRRYPLLTKSMIRNESPVFSYH